MLHNVYEKEGFYITKDSWVMCVHMLYVFRKTLYCL